MTTPPTTPPTIARPRRGPRVAAVVLLLFALNALWQGFRQSMDWDTSPPLLGIERWASGTVALVAAIGAWRYRRWSAPWAALYGILAGILIATLGPVLDLEPSARSGLWLGALIVVGVVSGIALYLRRALAPTD